MILLISHQVDKFQEMRVNSLDKKKPAGAGFFSKQGVGKLLFELQFLYNILGFFAMEIIRI